MKKTNKNKMIFESYVAENLEFEGKEVSEVIEILQQYSTNNPLEKLTLRPSWHDSCEFDIISIREETDEELEIRIRETQEKERQAQEEKQILALMKRDKLTEEEKEELFSYIGRK